MPPKKPTSKGKSSAKRKHEEVEAKPKAEDEGGEDGQPLGKAESKDEHEDGDSKPGVMASGAVLLKLSLRQVEGKRKLTVQPTTSPRQK